MTRFNSILFERPEDAGGADQSQEPDFFSDLNLDQVVDWVTAGRRYTGSRRSSTSRCTTPAR